MNKYFLALIVLYNDIDGKYTYDLLFMACDNYDNAKKQAYNVTQMKFKDLIVREIVVMDLEEQINMMKSMEKNNE